MVRRVFKTGRRERGVRAVLSVASIAGMLIFGVFAALDIGISLDGPLREIPGPHEPRFVLLAKSVEVAGRAERARNAQTSAIVLFVAFLASTALLLFLRRTRSTGTLIIERRGLLLRRPGETQRLLWSELAAVMWTRHSVDVLNVPASERNGTTVVTSGIMSLAADDWVAELRDGSDAPPIILDGKDFYRPAAALEALEAALPERFPRRPAW